jgi:hypothetical protein
MWMWGEKVEHSRHLHQQGIPESEEDVFPHHHFHLLLECLLLLLLLRHEEYGDPESLRVTLVPIPWFAVWRLLKIANGDYSF